VKIYGELYKKVLTFYKKLIDCPQMNATIAPNEIAVRYSSRPDVNREFLTIDCPNDWDDVKKLTKKVLIYDGRRFIFTGWNSDRHECFFARSLSFGLGSQTAKIVARTKKDRV